MSYKSSCLQASVLGFLAFFFSLQMASAQNSQQVDATATAWVDSVIQSMDINHKVGQLMMVATYSTKGNVPDPFLIKVLDKYGLGGVIFMQGSPEAQIAQINTLQHRASLPLLIGQDAEWGPGMRLKDTPSLPKNMTLGAIQDDSLLYTMGQELARELKLLGVRLNFAPVADINNNPNNPVINYRSFGENKYNVARKVIMLAKGMEGEGVLACIKHFPGHGDTNVDSHAELPLIPFSKERLDTMELYPFIKSIEQDASSCLMTAHLNIPALDNTANLPSTLSPKIVEDLARKQLGFKGLLITDALNMKGVTKYHRAAEASVMAFKAGNDLLLYPEDFAQSVYGIKKALKEGEISQTDLDEKLKRILHAKYRLGLHKSASLSTVRIQEKLFSPQMKILRQKLYESSLTLVKNDSSILPLTSLANKKIAVVNIGKLNSFNTTLRKYSEIKYFNLSRKFTPSQQIKLISSLEKYNVVIFSIQGNWKSSQQYGIDKKMAALSQKLKESDKKVILALFSSPYALKDFGGEDAILMAYESAPDAQQAAAAAIFGGITVNGRLSITASEQFPESCGLDISKSIRFGFSTPEEMGMDSRILGEIDSLAEYYIQQAAMPGCAILVAKGNNIVYEKGFGSTQPAGQGMAIHPWFHTYDLASLTKACVTTISTMKLEETAQLKLDKSIGHYIPEYKGTDIGNSSPRALLQHKSGLPSWKPFYKYTFIAKSQTLNPLYYSTSRNKTYRIPISSKLFGSKELSDSVWHWISQLETRKTKRVRYSDIGMIVMGRTVEAAAGIRLDHYIDLNFYRHLGMNSTYYTPAIRGFSRRCPPTVKDNYWRKETLTGFVHDEASAILGGRAGHAGLFANVYDLAKLFMMLKNGGEYGGQRFLKKETIERYTAQQFKDNRKGLGWDKPEIFAHKTNPVSKYASASTFGHTGFTGTAAWVDPENDIIFIFLSNRTYPSASNRTLMRANVRTRMMDKIYESMGAGSLNANLHTRK